MLGKCSFQFVHQEICGIRIRSKSSQKRGGKCGKVLAGNQKVIPVDEPDELGIFTEFVEAFVRKENLPVESGNVIEKCSCVSKMREKAGGGLSEYGEGSNLRMKNQPIDWKVGICSVREEGHVRELQPQPTIQSKNKQFFFISNFPIRSVHCPLPTAIPSPTHSVSAFGSQGIFAVCGSRIPGRIASSPSRSYICISRNTDAMALCTWATTKST